MEYIQNKQLHVILIVNQSFFVGKMILQILRNHQKASDNQYEHSYIYILKPFNEMPSSGLRNVS